MSWKWYLKQLLPLKYFKEQIIIKNCVDSNTKLLSKSSLEYVKKEIKKELNK